MPINEPHEDLPARRPNGNAPVPSDEQMIAAPIAAAWWEQFQAGPDFRRARAIPELPLRASAVSQRCDRQFWYSLTDIEPTDASDAASVFRMRLGSIVHDELDKSDVLKGHTANGHKWGWFPEEAIDLRPAGFPGSAHGDWIFYDDNQPLEVAEIKTVGGYGYKLMASNFNGPPEGPKWEHAMQAAIVAVAVGAQRIRLVYFSFENLAPDVARAVGADEFGRFCAEWVYDMDEPFPGTTKTLREAVAAEAKRQIRILHLAQPAEGDDQILPERTLSHPSYPGGAMVTNPAPARGKATWVKLDMQGTVRSSGTTWICDYCDFRKRCIEDGAASVTISTKTEGTPTEELRAEQYIGPDA